MNGWCASTDSVLQMSQREKKINGNGAVHAKGDVPNKN